MTAQRTALHPWHQEHGASFSEFGGYEMPLWYGSAKDEHLAVLTTVGMFDTSHMSAVRVQGPDALALLQHCFSNNLDACVGPKKTPLVPGRCVYGTFLNAQGHVVDDAICFMLGQDNYLVVINAGMGDTIAQHLQHERGGRKVDARNLAGLFGKIDVQGPLAARVMGAVLQDPESVLGKLPYFSFKGGLGEFASDTVPVVLHSGTPIFLSRTGYTGEFGFEILTAADTVVAVWQALHDVVESMGGRACGLAARDSLRAGAVLPLSHQDIGAWPFVQHPWPFALAWAEPGVSFSKAFLGSQALLDAKDAPHTYAFVGFDSRKVSAPATAHLPSGDAVGDVLTCVTDMGLGRVGEQVLSVSSPDKPQGFNARGLCCGFVRVKQPLQPGDAIELHDERRKLKVVITSDIRPDRSARKLMKHMYP